MKKILLLGLALLSMISANAQDKTVLYEYPFVTMRGHAYPTTGEYTQNNLLDLNGVGNVTTTITAYSDGTYKIAAWCGVEGYDLDFRLSNDSIYVLNENAEYKSSKGYWKVPTGLTTYDRIQVWSHKVNDDNTLRTEIKVSETMATLNIGYNSYVWEVGNTGNATVMSAYYGRGFAATPAKYTVQEAAWDDESSDYVTTYDLNTQKITETNVYAIGENQYVATDWMGENTGDLYFTVDENDSITVDNIADFYTAGDGFFYYYNVELADDGIQPTWAEAYNDGTCFGFGFWYGTDATDSDSYIYRYYFLEPETDAIKTVTTNVSDNAIYNLNGVRMNSSINQKGIYIINGKKVIK